MVDSDYHPPQPPCEVETRNHTRLDLKYKAEMKTTF